MDRRLNHWRRADWRESSLWVYVMSRNYAGQVISVKSTRADHYQAQVEAEQTALRIDKALAQDIDR